ncbi:polysaccharide pyruvyl transferase family protein [Thermaurantiacus sp.]
MVRGFESLDNYGTGMMGLVAIDRLHRLAGGRARFLLDLFADASLDEVEAELGGPRADLELCHLRRIEEELAPAARRIAKLPLVGRARGMDLVVVLGGDTLADTYTRRSWRFLAAIGSWSLDAPVVLLGHTIGPFHLPQSRLAAKLALPWVHIVPRDQWTTGYLQSEFGIARRVVQGTDLAFADLPLQDRTDIRNSILSAAGLAPDRYATLIVSALQTSGKFYTSDTDLYLRRHAELATMILARPEMADARLLLLAHTHGKTYGDEARFIREVVGRLPESARARVATVTERVLPTRARFLLGNGLFTVTGRMHPAVSTFQMGKPAITLAYSRKYEGVIGTMLGRRDLIVDANDPGLWVTGAIVEEVRKRLDRVAADRPRLLAAIAEAVARQKALLDSVFCHLGRLIA